MTSELSLEELEAEFADQLPTRDLMAICTPIVLFALVGGVLVTSTSLICINLPALPIGLPLPL